MRRSAIGSALVLWGLSSGNSAVAQEVQAAQQAQTPAARVKAPAVQHAPINEAIAGEPTVLRFVVRAPDAGRIAVRCTRSNEQARVIQRFAQLAGDDYRVELPAACVALPALRYYAVLISADGSEQPLFASAAAPHRVRVTYGSERESELRRLRARGWQRSTVRLAAEGVDFGTRKTAAGTDLPDRYYRLEAGYAYAFYERIEDISLTLVRVRGQGGNTVGDTSELLDPGIDFGRANVTLFAFDFLRLRSALLLGASQQGFEWGGSGEIVLGDPLAEHMLIGVESLTTLGSTGYVSLGFNASRAIPMAARVELTDFPLGSDAAVRLLYEIGYRFTPMTELVVRAGYQGRTSVIGGPSLGAVIRYGF